MNELSWWLLRRRLRSIQLLVLDVDGVLTDGGLWLDAKGNLSKRFDVRDGLGIRLLQQEGLQIAFLSGGLGGATEARALQLGIKHCLVGIKDKPSALRTLQKQLGVSIAQTAFVGDDLNDLAVRRWSGCCSHLPMPVSRSAASPMQCCNAEEAMELSVNWWNAFFKCAAAGDDCIEKVGREEMITPL